MNVMHINKVVELMLDRQFFNATFNNFKLIGFASK